jgi:hypothetical protein
MKKLSFFVSMLLVVAFTSCNKEDEIPPINYEDYFFDDYDAQDTVEVNSEMNTFEVTLIRTDTDREEELMIELVSEGDIATFSDESLVQRLLFNAGENSKSATVKLSTDLDAMEVYTVVVKLQLPEGETATIMQSKEVTVVQELEYVLLGEGQVDHAFALWELFYADSVKTINVYKANTESVDMYKCEAAFNENDAYFNIVADTVQYDYTQKIFEVSEELFDALGGTIPIGTPYGIANFEAYGEIFKPAWDAGARTMSFGFYKPGRLDDAGSLGLSMAVDITLPAE